jgi:hypothetical protein
MITQTIKHPLINREDSPHYDSEETPAILDFERTYSLTDLRAWSKLTLAKYEHPSRANKGEVAKDMRKATTYRNYYHFLDIIIKKYPPLSDITAVNAYDALGYKMEY